MSSYKFEEARRENMMGRILFIGPAGAGKTEGALRVASNLFGGTLPIYGIDSEHGRMKLYANRYRFKHLDLTEDQSPEAYIKAIGVAEHDARINNGGKGVLIIDSVSHEWMGAKGILQEADRFGDWKTVRPRHSRFVEKILASPLHIICCCRAKMKYEVTEEPRPGGGTKQVVTKLGIGPVQDEALIYEFDIVAMIDVETHLATFSNRCETLVDTTRMLDEEVAGIITTWLSEGEPPATKWYKPDSWQNLNDRLNGYAGIEWPVWIDQAVMSAWGITVAEGQRLGEALTKPQAEELFDRLCSVLHLIEGQTGQQDISPPSDEMIRAAFSESWEGMVVNGPTVVGAAAKAQPANETDDIPFGEAPPE